MSVIFVRVQYRHEIKKKEKRRNKLFLVFVFFLLLLITIVAVWVELSVCIPPSTWDREKERKSFQIKLFKLSTVASRNASSYLRSDHPPKQSNFAHAIRRTHKSWQRQTEKPILWASCLFLNYYSMKYYDTLNIRTRVTFIFSFSFCFVLFCLAAVNGRKRRTDTY